MENINNVKFKSSHANSIHLNSVPFHLHSNPNTSHDNHASGINPGKEQNPNNK